MTVGSVCTRSVVAVPKSESIVDVAKRMRMLHVGTVIVIEDRNSKHFPVGILTDRDIVLTIVASEPEHLPSILVRDVINDNLLTAHEDTSLADAVKMMEERGVRRLPVVDDDGALIGIVTANDVIRFLAEQLNHIVQMMSHGEQVERHHHV